MKNGAQIFWQTGAAESKSWLEIIGRDVQLGVFAEDLHHLVAIDTHALTQIANLIRKTYFHGVKCVTGILDHLSYRNGYSLNRTLQIAIDSRKPFRRKVIAGSNYGKGRVIKIINCGGFSHEFRVHADAKLFSGLLTGRALK